MCLYFNPETQKEQIKKLFGRKQSITVFKHFEIETLVNRKEQVYNVLCPPYRGGKVKTKRGFYISDRKSKNITKGKISHGIHVYLRQPSMLMAIAGIYVPSTAYKKDLVAISNASTEAVFMKIKLPTDIVKKYKTNIKPKRTK